MRRELCPFASAQQIIWLCSGYHVGSGAGTGVGAKMFLQAPVDNASNGTDKRFAGYLWRV
jgi:hypothetical protein